MYSCLICKLGIKHLKALSHRTLHRWVLNIEYLSDKFTFFKVRSKWSFICHFPPVLGVFGCMGLELKCLSAGLRGGPTSPLNHPPHTHPMKIWFSCLCNFPAASWTSRWYLTSYRYAAQVRVGRRGREWLQLIQMQPQVSLFSVLSEDITQGGSVSWKWVVKELLADTPAAGNNSDLSAWSREDRTQHVSLCRMGKSLVLLAHG